MAKCNNCGCPLPPGTAVSTRVLKGYRGRKNSGVVLMCEPCSRAIGEQNQTVAIFGLIVIAILVGLFVVLAAYK
jgi:hypothetical protein